MNLGSSVQALAGKPACLALYETARVTEANGRKMSQPLRKYAQTSDEVEHLDNELSESLAKIRADIEVCAFIYRAL